MTSDILPVSRRVRIPFLTEALILVLAAVAFLLFPYNLAFLTRILILMIFVLSIDLVLGYAGIDTLGQAAMYGAGAYAAGLFAIHVSSSPLPGLAVGAAAGAVLALISGLMVLRMKGLTLIVMTVAVAQVCQEVANKARGVTGGADGLGGIEIGPLPFGFEFDFIGQAGFWYALAVLMAVVVFLRVLTAAPLGLSARGLQESKARMTAIGTPVYRRLVTIYTIGGAIAGIAGALSAQITLLVTPEVFSFILSAEGVLMLILGGSGRIVGALLGTLVFTVVHHTAAAANPYNWLFVIGALVLAVVFFVPKGLLGLPEFLTRLWRKP